MKFSTSKEMYNYIADGNDLYNPAEELYVFVYNDAGALCSYRITEKEAMALRKESKETKESWSAFLGTGGTVYDNPDFEALRYDKKASNRALYLSPSYDLCEKLYRSECWVNVSKLLKGAGNS